MSAGAPGTPPATGGPGNPPVNQGNGAAPPPTSGPPPASGNPPATPPTSANMRSGAEDEESSDLDDSVRERDPKRYYEKLERENVRRRLALAETRNQLAALTAERDSFRAERDAL